MPKKKKFCRINSSVIPENLLPNKIQTQFENSETLLKALCDKKTACKMLVKFPPC